MTDREFCLLVKCLARTLGAKGDIVFFEDMGGMGTVVHRSSRHILGYYMTEDVAQCNNMASKRGLAKSMKKQMKEAMWRPVFCCHCGFIHEQPDALEQVEACLREKGASKK